MNLKRVFAYTGILLLSTGVVGFVFGFLIAVFKGRGLDVPLWVPVATAIGAQAVSVAVYARLAAVQRQKPFTHGFFVAILTWLVSYVLSVLFLKVPFFNWLDDVFFGFLAMVIGIGLGRMLTARRQGLGEPVRQPPTGQAT